MSKEQAHEKMIALEIAGKYCHSTNFSAKTLTENAAVIYGFLIENTYIVYPDEVSAIAGE